MAFKIKNDPIQIKQVEDEAVTVKFGQSITTQSFMPDPEKIIIRRRRGARVAPGQGGGVQEPFWGWEDGTEMRWQDDTSILTED